jgi:hypothetical protein
MPLELFPFRYRDARTGRWVKARYKGTPEEIAIRYAEWEITGPAELRSDVGGAFNPYRFVPHAELRRLQEEAPEINPHLARPPAVDAIEWVVVGCVVVAIFLRRYVTYCACRRRYSQMESAARLHREIVTAKIALDARNRTGHPQPDAAYAAWRQSTRLARRPPRSVTDPARRLAPARAECCGAVSLDVVFPVN